MSAARAIVEVCNVAQSHDMPMPSSVLDGLVQLIQQTTDPNVRHTTCSSAVPENKQKIVSSRLKQHMTQNILFVNFVLSEQKDFSSHLDTILSDTASEDGAACIAIYP